MEEGRFSDANTLINQILSVDPENSKAYVAQLLAEHKLSEEAMLNDCGTELQENISFKRALRFANTADKEILLNYAENGNKNLLLSKQRTYENAEHFLRTGDYASALLNFSESGDYKDAEERAKQTQHLAQQEEMYLNAEKHLQSGKFKKALHLFTHLGNYKNSQEKVKQLQELSAKEQEAIKRAQQEEVYIIAKNFLQLNEYEKALILFAKLGDYKDAKEKAEELEKYKKQKEKIRAYISLSIFGVFILMMILAFIN
ncbi:MAG: hypothetical protein FWB80_04040 [Defluviitaleaceae bacterium]|nr:hypothetical protein [Defluviitaleaceae bacterium]